MELNRIEVKIPCGWRHPAFVPRRTRPQYRTAAIVTCIYNTPLAFEKQMLEVSGSEKKESRLLTIYIQVYRVSAYNITKSVSERPGWIIWKLQQKRADGFSQKISVQQHLKATPL